MANNSEAIKITDVLCELFEVIIHNILYVRKLYPESIFVRKRKYGIVVYKSVHPQLNEYIVNCLKAVEFHLKMQRLKKLHVCISANGTVIERYVFDILCIQHKLEDINLYVKLETVLRDLCLKLHTKGSYLSTLPEEASFSIQLHTAETSSKMFNDDPVFEDFPWILINGKRDEIPHADIVPLYTIDTESLKLQMYIEKCCKD